MGTGSVSQRVFGNHTRGVREFYKVKLGQSMIVTAPLLHMTASWDNANFSLYVEDGNVFASGPTFDLAALCAATAANKVLGWLRTFGLMVDGDKTEVMF